MTSPITSSIIAALVRTTPSLDCAKPLVLSTVKVVPRLVEDNAAPAAKHCSGVASITDRRMKESPMGKLIPVIATQRDNKRLALREGRDVDKPPASVSATHRKTDTHHGPS
jgi:hypothetical protein